MSLSKSTLEHIFKKYQKIITNRRSTMIDPLKTAQEIVDS